MCNFSLLKNKLIISSSYINKYNIELNKNDLQNYKPFLI